MRCRLLRSALLALVSSLFACSVKIPDATFTCRDDAGCPSGFSCSSEGLCTRGELPGDAGGLDGSVELDAACGGEGCEENDAGEADAACSDCDAAPDGDAPDARMCSAELCNGLDDNCDQQVDEGLLQLALRRELPQVAQPYYTRILPLPDGGVLILQSVYKEPSLFSIFATRLSAGGELVRGPSAISDSNDGHFEAVVVDESVLVLRAGAWLVLSVYSLADFTTASPQILVSTEARSGHVLDVVATRDALGPRLWALFDVQGAVSIASFRPPNTLAELRAITLHTPSGDEDPAFTTGRLVAAPCNLGLYAVLARRAAPSEVRVIPLSSAGAVTGPGFKFSHPAPEVAFGLARPALVGGTCAVGPSELLLAWSSSPLATGASTGHLNALGLSLTSAAGEALTPSWQQRIETKPAFPEVLFGTPSAPVAMTLTPSGRIFAAAATVDFDAAIGDLELHELHRGGGHTRQVTEQAPRMPSVIDMANLGGAGERVHLGLSAWLDKGPLQLRELVCR